MRPTVMRRMAWLLLALVAWANPPVAWSDPPEVAAATSALDAQRDPETVLKRGLELERKRSWQAAIDVYQTAHEQWPSRTEFSRRRLLCETHYKLTRRYQDQSFRTVLLRLPREKALALYDEMLERIQTHYVDDVALEPLLRRGLDNLEVALRDPEFLRGNVGEIPAERVTWLREALRARRNGLTVPNRHAAQTQVLAVCDLAQRALNLGPAPVILEFAYGACDALDDYTTYLTPDKLEDLYAMIDGNFVGLGIELKLETKGLKIVGVIRGGPAAEAGLKGGDQITSVGTRQVRGLSLDEAANLLQGDEGTTVELGILRVDGSTRNFRITRRHVEVDSVAQTKIVDPASGIGYVQLTGFQKTSTEELDRAIAGLRRQGMRSLVLDLRGNPGGLLNVAVEMAERFIDNGVIVSTRGRAPGQSQVYRAASRALWAMPLTVLIDRDSASASEILAGALKDHGRALVFGERSYGKGSVQSIFALRTAPAGLKLTTAKFYSPRNRPYSEQGVEPDIIVRLAAKPPVTPTGDDPAPEADRHQPPAYDWIVGDPLHDPVLEKALAHAKRRLNAAR